MAFSAGGTHIATAQKRGSIVTVLDLLNGTQQSININVHAQDVKIFDNTIFVTDGHKLICQHFGMEGIVPSACGDRRKTMDMHVRKGEGFTLSNDCSQVAFAFKRIVFLYDIKAQKGLGKLTTDSEHILNIQFSPDGCQLWVIGRSHDFETCICYRVELGKIENLHFTNVNTENLEDGWSCDSLF